MRTASTSFRYKDRKYNIQAKWHADANVWIATTDDLPGLVIEARTWQTMLKEIELTAPAFIESSVIK